MKKLALVLFVLTLSVPFLFSDGNQPNFVYKPGNFGLFLPEDTQVSEEKGVTFYESKKGPLDVLISKTDKAMSNADIIDPAKFKAAIMGMEGIVNILNLGSFSPEGDLVFNSAKVTQKWEDGTVDQGYVLFVNSRAAAGKTFIVGIYAEKIKDDWDDPAYTAYYSISYIQK